MCVLFRLLFINFEVKQKQFYNNLESKKRGTQWKICNPFLRKLKLSNQTFLLYIKNAKVQFKHYFPNLLVFLTIVFLEHLKMTDFSIPINKN